MTRLTSAIETALRLETDPDAFLRVKESLISFIMTVDVRESCSSYASLKLIFFIVSILLDNFSKRIYHGPFREVHKTFGNTI